MTERVTADRSQKPTGCGTAEGRAQRAAQEVTRGGDAQPRAPGSLHQVGLPRGRLQAPQQAAVEEQADEPEWLARQEDGACSNGARHAPEIGRLVADTVGKDTGKRRAQSAEGQLDRTQR